MLWPPSPAVRAALVLASNAALTTAARAMRTDAGKPLRLVEDVHERSL
jgi:hypothetical protein